MKLSNSDSSSNFTPFYWSNFSPSSKGSFTYDVITLGGRGFPNDDEGEGGFGQ